MNLFSSIEALESRIAPAVLTLALSATGKLSVTADDAAATVSISSATVGTVTTYTFFGLNNTTFALAKANPAITLSTNAVANDIATLVATSIAIKLGDSVNSISLGNGAQGLSVAGDLSITGGDFADSIVVGALGFGVTVGKAFTVKLGEGDDKLVFAGTGISSFGKTTLDFGKNTNLQAPGNELATNGASSLTFTDSLTVAGGAFSDYFNLGQPGGTVVVSKNLTINTGTGIDRVSILGANISVGGNLAVAAKAALPPAVPTNVKIAGDTTLTVTGGVSIKGSATNIVSLTGGIVQIDGAVTIAGGTEDDTVTIDPVVVGNIGGKLSVAAGKGTNRITLTNTIVDKDFAVIGLTGDDRVIFTGGKVTGTVNLSLGTGDSDVKLENTIIGALTAKSAGIALAIDRLTLNNVDIGRVASITHGAGDSAITMDSVQAHGAFTLKAGAGTNNINIAAVAGSGISHFFGTTVISGGAGADTLSIGLTQGVDEANFAWKLNIALGLGTDKLNLATTDVLALAALQAANTFAPGIPPIVTGVTT